MSMKSVWLIIGILGLSFESFGQIVYQDLQKTSVYDFLDELANSQVIELNTFSKPYSRELIALKLKEAQAQLSQLNQRQRKELTFFLKDFNKELEEGKNFDKRYDLFYHKDSVFTFSLNPILGARYWTNENGNNWHRWHGGELFGYIQDNFGVYFSLRDNIEKDLTQNEQFLNQQTGVNYKGSGEYSEVKGGLTYSWKWGSLGLLRDNFTWGNHTFGANIFSGKAPPFARLSFRMHPVKWLDFEYFHAWLASEVRDSIRSYTAGARQRVVFVNKFIASNRVSITPLKRLTFTLGNSIVYSDNLQPVFFIPVLFFKSVDHSIYSSGGNYGGANTQMFFDISSRNIKKVHLYTSLYIDEISVVRLLKPDEHSNFISWKMGATISNILDKNVGFNVEYTRTNPITYRHFVNTTTFESNKYNMGHYLRDNAHELAVKLTCRPIARLNLSATYSMARKGEEYEYLGTGTEVWGLKFIEDLKWQNQAFNLHASYELINDLYLSLDYQYQNITGEDKVLYTQDLFLDKTNTIFVGLAAGF